MDTSFRQGTQGPDKDAFMRHLHDDAPVHRDAAGYWVISRFDDVRAVLLDHANFSSAAMGAEFPLLSDDPPRHSTLRGLINKAFTPARIEALRPGVDALAQELTARIPAGQDVDVVAALTSPVPVAVIARMLGVPTADHARFKRWSDAIIGLMDDPFGGERMRTMQELHQYFMGLVHARRATPGDDLISAVARADEAGVVLSDQEVVGFINLLLLAGNETTTNLLSNLLERLSTRPEQWARLRADPALIDGAIEEALRTDSPAQYVVRRARADVVVGDAGRFAKDSGGNVANIAAGDSVIVYLAAANRDATKWEHPDNFDVARERERHLGFGHGVHFCLGAPLARVEAHAVMSALVARFATVSPGSSPGVRLPVGVLFGYRVLPLVFGVS